MHTILLVDDDPGVLKGIGDMLERSGYGVLTAKDGRSAIRHHHENFHGTGYPLGLKGNEIPFYWPGNVREPQNVVHRTFPISQRSAIGPADPPLDIAVDPKTGCYRLDDVEREHIPKVLREIEGRAAGRGAVG